jgi:SAM-dependent methyltransferase
MAERRQSTLGRPRFLREHLDDSHGAASRVTAERLLQTEWLWDKLDLRDGDKLLDVTCGPGLYATEFASRGCYVTGVDFSPASMEYARELTPIRNVGDRCTFIEQDVRQMKLSASFFDAALFIYGQLAVFAREEAQQLLAHIAQSLKPGGRLCVEMLDQARLPKKDSSWWYTDDSGLWGDAPYLHLGERLWLEEEAIFLERFHILHLESGKLDEITLCDQTYSAVELKETILGAGFSDVEAFPSWDGLPLYDAEEWIVYVAKR